MKISKISVIIGIIFLCVLFAGFSKEWDKQFLFINDSKEDITIDRDSYLSKLKENFLLNPSVNSMEIENALSSGDFSKKEITSQGKLNQDFSYKVTASVVSWNTEGYFAICEVKNPTVQIYDAKNNKVKSDVVWADVKNGDCVPTFSDSAIELVFGCNFQDDPNDIYSYTICRVTTFIPKEDKVYFTKK